MTLLIKIIGTLVTGMGIIILCNPHAARRMMAFWRQGKNIYIGGSLRLLLGALFLYYAPRARVPQVLSVLGVLALLGGLLIFILGPEKVRVMLDWWDKQPENRLRLLSLLIIAFGILLLYAA
ncbi:MAG: hypothetical protein PHO03_00705 [Candidatus Omnitrophica bacterium]|nr:hypothetical protein [Candidatus Omnitrophota bacterium]